MARYEHLPIYAETYRLALDVERCVQGFSRFHKHAIGADLHALCRLMLRLIIRANHLSDKRPALEELRLAVEEFLVLTRLAKDTRAFSGLKAYEICANLVPPLASICTLAASRSSTRSLAACGAANRLGGDLRWL